MVKGRIVGQACVKCFRYDFNHSVNFTLTTTLMSVPFKSEWCFFFCGVVQFWRKLCTVQRLVTSTAAIMI